MNATPSPETVAPTNYQRPARGAQVDVFISYSRRDRVFIRRLFDRLETQGRAAWVDWESIPYSVDWWQEIQDGIDSANNVICVVSTGWLTSEMCNKEFAYAIQRNKRIIPVLRVDLDEKQVKTAWIDQPWEAQARANFDALKKINWLYSRKRSDGHEYAPNAEPDPETDVLANDIDSFEQAYQNLIRTIETDDDFTKQHTRLLIEAREWETANHNESYLLHDIELDSAQAWLNKSQTKTPKPTPLHHEYIDASANYRIQLLTIESERKRQMDRSARRAALFGQLAVIVGVIATLLVATAVVVASNQVANANATLTPIPPTLTHVAQVIAQGEARITSLDMASAAEAILQEANPNKSLAAALAIRGLRVAYTEQADAVLVKIMAHAQKPRNLAADARISVLSPAGDYAAVVPFMSDKVYLYNLRDPGSPTMLEHGSRVQDAVFSPDGTTLLTFADDRTARLWVVEDGALLRFFLHRRGVNSVAFSPNGRLVMTTTSDHVVHLWDVMTGRELQTLSHAAPIVQAVFSPDGRSILTRTENLEADRVHVWDVASGAERKSFQHNAEVISAVFSPDSQTVLTGSMDGIVRLWDAVTGSEKFRSETLDLNTGPASFSPDGSVFAAFPTAKTLQLWNVRTGAVLFELATPAVIRSMAISPDSRFIATAGDDNMIRLWDFVTGKLLRVLADPELTRKLVFSPDSGALIALSDSRIARVWDPVTGNVRRVLTHSDAVFGAVFSPDDALILTRSGGAPQLWETNYADFLTDVCSVFLDGNFKFKPQERLRYSIPENDPAPCGYFDSAGTFVPPNPPLPPSMTPAATSTAAPRLFIPSLTPSPPAPTQPSD